MTRCFAVAFALAAATVTAQAPDAGVAPAACALDVEIRGLKDGGVVWVLLFGEAQADAYPTKRDRALARVDVALAGGLASAHFGSLACGEFAVAVVHDENGDGKLGTNFIGIPNEGLGASRNAKGLFGPPTFSAAKVRLAPGVTALPIDIDY